MTSKSPKKFEVIQATKRPIDGVNVDGKDLKFGRLGGFQITDAALAKDIQQSVGQDGRRDVLVIPIDNNRERGRTQFAMPRNWKGFTKKVEEHDNAGNDNPASNA